MEIEVGDMLFLDADDGFMVVVDGVDRCPETERALMVIVRRSEDDQIEVHPSRLWRRPSW